MKTKFLKFSLVSFILAVLLFILSYYLFHYLTAEGTFSMVWQEEARKPFITNLFAIWGVTHLFASVTSLLAAVIILD